MTKKPKAPQKSKDGESVATLEDMENNAKSMFDAIDRKTGLGKRPD